MGDPRNPKRIDELWDAERLRVAEGEVRAMALVGVLSGGWAWHFMSPPHVEKKIHHDHKDVDLIVPKAEARMAFQAFDCEGYERIWTKYDRVSNGDFYRYEKRVEGVKILVDVFLSDVPFVTPEPGIRVVEPHTLLSWYSAKKHTTDDCTAVRAAKLLIEKGIHPVKRGELIGVGLHLLEKRR